MTTEEDEVYIEEGEEGFLPDTPTQRLLDHSGLGPIEFAKTVGVSPQCLYQLRMARTRASFGTWEKLRRAFSKEIRELGYSASDFMAFEDE